MAKRRKKYEEWPHVRHHWRGRPTFDIGPWTAIELNAGYWSSVADVYLDGTREDEHTRSLGRVRVRRPIAEDGGGKQRLCRVATVSLEKTEEQVFNHQLGIIQCATWEDALAGLSAFDIAGVLAKEASTIYGAPDKWTPIRPFSVVYPWRDQDEPNRLYTPFRLIGAWPIEQGSECVMHRYAADPFSMRAVAVEMGANAFLSEHRPGSWRVYHRRSMLDWDPIDIDDFYARLIAGSGDDNDRNR